MSIGKYGLRRRSAVRARLTRRLRSVAVVGMLAVIWLGYSVVHELAAERPRGGDTPAAVSQDLSSPGEVHASAAPSLGRLKPLPGTGAFTPVTDSETFVPSATTGILVSDDSWTSPDAGLTQDDLSSQPEKPSLQAALTLGAPGVAPGRHALPGSSYAGGGGGGGGGGSAAGSQGGEASEASADSGDGRPRVLGHALGNERGESEGSVDSNSGSGSSSSSGANGNSDSNGGGSSSGVGDSGGKGAPTGTTALTTNSASNGSIDGGANGSQGDEGTKGGSAAANGSAGGSNDQVDNAGARGGNDGGPAGTASFATAALEADDVPIQVPEPGSILLAIGVAAAFARRRAR